MTLIVEIYNNTTKKQKALEKFKKNLKKMYQLYLVYNMVTSG